MPKNKSRRAKSTKNHNVASSAMVASGVATGARPGFPHHRDVVLRYVDMQKRTTGTGNADKYQYRLNSAFDPDYTGTGVQPYGFDQWSALYNHYVVTRADVTILVDGFNASPSIAGMYVSDDATILTDGADLCAAGAIYGMISNGTQPIKLDYRFDTARFFSRGSVATDDQLRANVGSNPSEVAILTVFSQDIARLTALAVGFTVQIDYHVRFMEPKDVAPSYTQVAKPTHLEGRWTTVEMPTPAPLTKGARS